MTIEEIKRIARLPIKDEEGLASALNAVAGVKNIIDNERKELLKLAELESTIACVAARYAVSHGLAKAVRHYSALQDPNHRGDDPTYQWTRYELMVGGRTYYLTQTCKEGKWVYLWN